MSTVVYGSDRPTWPMTVTNRKRLEAAHHRWLRRILCVSWLDKITNKIIRETTGQEDMENIIRKRRLRFMGHIVHMDEGRRAKLVMLWIAGRRRMRGRPRKNCRDTIKSDLRCLEMSWDEAEELAMNREEWRKCVVRCADMHV